MSTPDAPARRRGGELRLTIALYVALIAAGVPLLDVVDPGPWLVGVYVVAAVILSAGYVARRYRLPAIAVTLIEAGLWAAMVSAIFFNGSALLWVIPTPEVFREIPELIDLASQEITLGVAPLDASGALSFILIASMGLVTILLDHVVLTARMPLLAVVALVAIWLIPALAVTTDVDIIQFAFLAVASLYLIRAETRSRETAVSDRRPDSGVAAMAAAIGTVAVIVAVFATPALPQPSAVAAGGLGAPVTIDPTLELGDDLRQPRDVPVLTVQTNGGPVPYLRAVTLSQFDGQVWLPDQGRSLPLAEGALGDVPVQPDVRVTEYRTTIAISQLDAPWAPVPSPAVNVEGLDGEWLAMPSNRTVLSRSLNTQGQNYVVTTHVPRPTLEQIRAIPASARELGPELERVPAGLPPIIAETALSVTASATTDYDKLIALQRFFRGSSFSYSLLAPVADGFDGTGSDAIAQFLEVREGYCVHFAAAFAVMARTLGMPTRIVVGFLPGSLQGYGVENQGVAQVSSSQLHAWPEVHFDGIGWVPFEPTKSLGTPTSFTPAASANTDDGGEDITGPLAAATRSPSDTVDPLSEDASQGEADRARAAAIDPVPFMWAVIVIILLLLLPTGTREVRRRFLLTRARDGDVMAAWRTVQDVAIDLGIAVPASETPRAFGARLVAAHDAPADRVHALVNAVERASYAPPGSADGRAAAADAVEIRGAMLAAAPAYMRHRSLVFPRSLIIRPGTGYAG